MKKSRAALERNTIRANKLREEAGKFVDGWCFCSNTVEHAKAFTRRFANLVLLASQKNDYVHSGERHYLRGLITRMDADEWDFDFDGCPWERPHWKQRFGIRGSITRIVLMSQTVQSWHYARDNTSFCGEAQKACICALSDFKAPVDGEQLKTLFMLLYG